MLNFLLVISGLLLFLFFIWFSVVSLFEKQMLAFKRSLYLSVVLALPFLFIAFTNFEFKEIVGFGILALLILIVIVLIVPLNPSLKALAEVPNSKIDERDTMFSRREITAIPELFDAYYKNKPTHLHLDNEWRKKPGLMSENSSMYSTIDFAAADASFYTIESLRNQVDGAVNSNKKEFNVTEITEFLREWGKKLGAVDVGFCELKPYHLYSHRGRGSAYGKEVNKNHKYAIAFTVEMDKDLLATGPADPTLMESAQQYLNSGIIAIQVAKFIRELGHEARAHIDGNYEVVCPLVARDAGLGELGRMGLLMTPTLGPRVRIAVVTTNLPMVISSRKPELSVQSFCAICKKCADVCPSRAISKNAMVKIDGAYRWQINQEKCFDYWCVCGTDCGRCMSVCPYSHPNNTLHNMVRWGIQNSILFRHFALHMDNFFYGKKPKPSKKPKWINVSPK